MDLDLGSIMDKVHVVIPYLSYFTTFFQKLFDFISNLFDAGL